MTNFVTSSTPSICKNEQWISGFFKKKICKHVTKFKTQPPPFMSTLQMYSHYNENALLMMFQFTTLGYTSQSRKFEKSIKRVC